MTSEEFLTQFQAEFIKDLKTPPTLKVREVVGDFRHRTFEVMWEFVGADKQQYSEARVVEVEFLKHYPDFLSVLAYRMRQEFALAFAKAGGYHVSNERRYGDDHTIHRTGEVNVELHEGKVVSVWYRCAVLPFTQHEVSDRRADDMKSAYRGRHDYIKAVVFG